MGTEVSFLVYTIWNGSLFRYAIKFRDVNTLPDGIMECPMEHTIFFSRAIEQGFGMVETVLRVEVLDGVAVIEEGE